jgi:hypothetical protein
MAWADTIVASLFEQVVYLILSDMIVSNLEKSLKHDQPSVPEYVLSKDRSQPDPVHARYMWEESYFDIGLSVPVNGPKLDKSTWSYELCHFEPWTQSGINFKKQ